MSNRLPVKRPRGRTLQAWAELHSASPPALSTVYTLISTVTVGLVALGATHPQVDEPLLQALIALAGEGEHLAVIVADNHFAADALARAVDAERLQVARGETPYQVRRLVQRLTAVPAAYSVVVIIGLLESFYDQQIQWQVARHLLADTLRLLQELARQLRVLVIVTPAPNATRPYLHAQLVQAADLYSELPALPPTAETLQKRLF